MRICLSKLLVLLALATSLFAQSSVDPGDAAPDFNLKDSAGTTYQLSDYRGEKAVVLEFFRSGDW